MPIRWALTHVSEESFERTPVRTDRYASASVIWEARVVGLVAAVAHVLPRSVLSEAHSSTPQSVSDCLRAMLAAARSYSPVSEMFEPDRLLASALALAHAAQTSFSTVFSGDREDGQSAELLTDKMRPIHALHVGHFRMMWGTP
jgi:hypothetical protein